MIIVPVLANIGGVAGFWSTFLALVILGWFSGLFQCMIYMENAKLPSNYIGIFLTSQGLAGIFSNLFRFASLEIWTENPFISTMINYLSGVLIMVLCIPAQFKMNKNKYARYY